MPETQNKLTLCGDEMRTVVQTYLREHTFQADPLVEVVMVNQVSGQFEIDFVFHPSAALQEKSDALHK